MSWKCNICDSYNEDDSSQCYVCGQPKTSQPIAKKTDTEKSVPDVTRINVAVDEPVRVKSSHTGFTFCAVLGVLLWIGWIVLTVCEFSIDPPHGVLNIILSIAVLFFFTGIPFHFLQNSIYEIVEIGDVGMVHFGNSIFAYFADFITCKIERQLLTNACHIVLPCFRWEV